MRCRRSPALAGGSLLLLSPWLSARFGNHKVQVHDLKPAANYPQYEPPQGRLVR